MRATILATALLLAGCGATAPLRPKTGDLLPPTPATARIAPTVDDLLTPPDQTRPQRDDELLKQSQQRPADRFDLPPTR